jgi:hypothetical protein
MMHDMLLGASKRRRYRPGILTAGQDRIALHIVVSCFSLRLGFVTQCAASCIPPRISLTRAHCRESIHSSHCQAFGRQAPSQEVQSKLKLELKLEVGQLISSQ